MKKASLSHRLKFAGALIAGVTASCLVFTWLLFYTSLGERMPEQLKLGAPVLIWVVTVWFLLAHRTPDGTGVDVKLK